MAGPGFGFQMIGDWGKAQAIFTGIEDRFRAVVKMAILQEAHFLRAKIVENITSGKHAPLADLTRAVRRGAGGHAGSKPLIGRGDLVNSVKVTTQGAMGVFVGIKRTATSKAGRGMANIAETLENGAGPFVVPITPKSRAFYHAALKAAGFSALPSKGGGGHAIAIVRIPARPFMGPVFKKYATPEMGARIAARVQEIFNVQNAGPKAASESEKAAAAAAATKRAEAFAKRSEKVKAGGTALGHAMASQVGASKAAARYEATSKATVAEGTAKGAAAAAKAAASTKFKGSKK